MVVFDECTHVGFWLLGVVDQLVTSSDRPMKAVTVRMIKGRLTRDVRCTNLLEGQEGEDDTPISKSGG